MKYSIYGETVVNEQDVFESLYNGVELNLADCPFDNEETIKQFNQAVLDNADNIPQIQLYTEPTDSLEAFDKNNQSNWFMPKEYKDFPMVEFLLDKTTNEEEYQRVVAELELFIQHDMMPLLNYLKYLVDTMRSNNIVWGVGRGSSVASYVLYLLGVHKIDSIKYGLDINEFLK
jgi:DNA polymerase III alpha subunit